MSCSDKQPAAAEGAAERKSTKSVFLAQMYPVLREVLDQNGSFSLTVTGTSMFPTLLGGRDQVKLVRPPERLQKYDLPLYRRRNGQFVLHRIVRVEEDGTYTCCGDHQWILEPGIRQEQIVALADSFVRKGKPVSVSAPGYLRWVRFWCRILPLRRPIFWVWHLPDRVRLKLSRAFHKHRDAE